MTLISLVYAQSRNGIIGHQGGLPWHIPSDLQRFKAITLGKPVIMGRKTWDSLPRKPLPGRQNIVITRQPSYVAEGADVTSSAGGAMLLAGGVREVCVIGGAEIYRMFLPLAGRIYLTEIDADHKGDTPAPELDLSQWQEISREGPLRGDRDTASFTIRVLDRL